MWFQSTVKRELLVVSIYSVALPGNKAKLNELPQMPISTKLLRLFVVVSFHEEILGAVSKNTPCDFGLIGSLASNRLGMQLSEMFENKAAS